jgi:hypothetical protein
MQLTQRENEMAKKPSNIVATINKGIDSLKATKRDIAEQIRSMQSNRRKYAHILNHIVTPEPGNGTINVSRSSIYVSYRDLSGFKDLRLETTLEGLTFIGEVQNTKDWPSLLNRDYVFDVPFADGSRIQVMVSAYVSEDSKTCRKVKVGEEYKVVDKFELVCD